MGASIHAVIKKSLLKFTFLFVFILSISSFAQRDSSQIIAYINQCNEIYYINPDSSFEFCLRAEKECKYQGNFNYAGEIALGKARYHILITDYERANSELTFAIDFFEQKKDYAKISKTYALKSILLDRIGEGEASTKVLREAYLISKERGDRPGEVSRLMNLSLDFIVNGDADSAYKYLVILESLSKYIKEDNRYFLEQNLGLYYHLVEDYTKAIYYYQRALSVAISYQMTDSKATVLAQLSESYRKLKMFTEAEQSGLDSYNFSVENRLVFEERDAIEQLVLLYEESRDFARAFDFRGRLIEIDERINKIEKVQQLKEDEYKLNLSEKEKKIAENELEIQEGKLITAKSESKAQHLYFVLIAIVLILTFVILIYLRTKKLNRTIELSRIILEQKNKEVMDSINYAKKIQDAILPPRKYYQSLLADVFVFYRPKDIVAGDFYWFDKVGNNIFFAVADCTGHGVPGAMVSVICHSALNRSVKEFGLITPAEILEKTSELVLETFVKSDREVKDGMDIALCVTDIKTNQLIFSGANNPVWIIKNSTTETLHNIPAKNIIANDEHILVELRGTKQPIGHTHKKIAFINQHLQLEKGDTIYLSSDGYIDQFGGDKGKKLKGKFFKEKLLQIQNSSMNVQQEMIVSVFDNWKGDLEQVDDVCVIGLKI